jgi:hypothetical protein
MTLAGALRDGLGATALRPGNCGPPGQPGAGVTRFIFLFVCVAFVGFPLFAPAGADCFSNSARCSARYAAVARADSARVARRSASAASSTSSIGEPG